MTDINYNENILGEDSNRILKIISSAKFEDAFKGALQETKKIIPFSHSLR